MMTFLPKRRNVGANSVGSPSTSLRAKKTNNSVRSSRNRGSTLFSTKVLMSLLFLIASFCQVEGDTVVEILFKVNPCQQSVIKGMVMIKKDHEKRKPATYRLTRVYNDLMKLRLLKNQLVKKLERIQRTLTKPRLLKVTARVKIVKSDYDQLVKNYTTYHKNNKDLINGVKNVPQAAAGKPDEAAVAAALKAYNDYNARKGCFADFTEQLRLYTAWKDLKTGKAPASKKVVGPKPSGSKAGGGKAQDTSKPTKGEVDLALKAYRDYTTRKGCFADFSEQHRLYYHWKDLRTKAAA